MKIAVPGNAMIFISAIADSGVGDGATGGTLSTELCKRGIGCFNESKLNCRLIVGRPKMKMKTEASRNGDQPFKTAPVECCFTVILFSVGLFSSTFSGLQNFRKATITSSEKSAATISTRLLS